MSQALYIASVELEFSVFKFVIKCRFVYSVDDSLKIDLLINRNSLAAAAIVFPLLLPRPSSL